MKKYFYTKECYIRVTSDIVEDILDKMQDIEDCYDDAESYVMENISTEGGIEDDDCSQYLITRIGIADMDEVFVESVKDTLETIFDGLNVDEIDYLNLRYN